MEERPKSALSGGLAIKYMQTGICETGFKVPSLSILLGSLLVHRFYF